MHPIDNTNPELIISKMTVIGLNYRHADVRTRSLFSISSLGCQSILEKAKEKGIRSLFVLSTCNRAELYGYCHDENDLVDLLVEHSRGTSLVFDQFGFRKRGEEALQHLFQVAAGLDSQITGDFEILGQLKTAVSLSRRQEMIGPIMDRTINFVLQASKSIRTNTKLTTGTVSVSYAAIEWLRKIKDANYKKILLFGAGKFGTTLAKNLKHYFPLCSATIINRTDKTAKILAESLSLQWKPYSLLIKEVESADIIIVSTNATEYTLHPRFFSGKKDQWILDISVPENADPAIRTIPGITVTGIDDISATMKATMTKRNKEIPKALSIIAKYQQEFFEWLQLQQHIPLINVMKDKLYELGEIHFCHKDRADILSSRINKTVGSLAMNLRYKNEKGCHYINAINEFLEPGSVNG